MAIKGKLDKETFESLGEELKPLYKPDGEVYRLDVEDMKHEEDIVALKSAKEEESKINKELRSKISSLESHNQNKDLTLKQLQEQYEEKYRSLENEKNNEIQRVTSSFTSSLVDKEAELIANELFVSPKLGLPHVKQRLSFEQGKNGFEIKVLDSKGQISPATIEDFKKELVANSDFKAIIKGNMASGSATKTSSSSAGQENGKPLLKMSINEKIDYLAQKAPDTFKKN